MVESMLTDPDPVQDAAQVSIGTQTNDEALRTENAELKRRIKALQEELADLKEEKTKEFTRKEEVTIAKKVLLERTCWSKEMISFFIDGKSQARWSSKDVVLGLTLRSLSRREYQYLRKKRLLPLPSLGTLRNYVANFTCPPGILENVLQGILLFWPSTALCVPAAPMLPLAALLLLCSQ